MIKIYHNPRCKKSRAGLHYVQERTNDFEVIEYLKNPISENVLKNLLIKLNLKPHDIVRTQEAIYRSNYKGKNFTDDEWVKIMVENPKLIKRPLVVKGNKAVLGDPADNLAVFFS
ncbi:MAG: arsenate reductase (glutaredoxin) [Bacteroidetes bacterium]|nr:arsenate reductase (glutaredoxin) [Bacteroidota bacterium]MBL6943287.1 arsenate reductase (glutaredoxin) [Bacteroidales bacterium]